MCKKTTNRASSLEEVSKIPANTPGSGSGSGTPPGPPVFDGVPEHVPAQTFIVERRIATDSFINGANAYHTNVGMAPQTIQSIGHMVQLLSSSSSRLNRIRIVTHANGNDMIVPLFGQTNVQADRHTFKEHLRGFADSDERGLLSILGLSLGGHFHGYSRSSVMSMIRSGNAALLAPFGLQASGVPDNNLEQFIFYCCDRAMVNRDWIKKGSANLAANEKAHLLRAMDALISLKAPAGAGAAPLRDFLIARTMNDLGLTNADFYSYGIPAGSLNLFLLAGRAADEVTSGFRGRLNTVRGRFDENSSIDIRGCRAGDDRDYLRAVQAFFGRSGHLPTVTGPRWYQFFGSCNHSVIANNGALRTLLTTGTGAAAVRAAFEEWAERSRINAQHKTHWLAQLNGNTVNFCRMTWRTTFPPVTLATPGFTPFTTMNFTDAVARIGVFFNVAAGSVPSGAPLTTINTFITTHLSAHFGHLLDAPTEANKTSLFTGLKQLNDALSLSLVPATAPAPLNVSHISGYQSALIGHCDANQLQPIRNFMTACRQRIEAAGDPGIAYYMVNSGMPVFLFRTTEAVAAHVVTVTNNRLVVHTDFADAAYRKWPPMLWAEALPAANTIDTLHVTDADARRFAMMVEQPDGGTTTVAACPHPEYADKIVTVTNTSDPF